MSHAVAQAGPHNICSFISCLVLPGLHFPEHLAQHAQPEFGIGGGEIHAADHPANFFLFCRDGALAQVAAGAKRIDQHGSDALKLPCRSSLKIFGIRDHFTFGGLAILSRTARQLVKTYRHRLPKIHRCVLFTRGDMQEPVAMAEVLIRQAALFRSKQKRHASSRAEPFVNQRSSILQQPKRMKQFPLSNGGCSNHQRAVSHRFRHAGVLFGFRHQRRCAHSGARFSKGCVVGIHHAQLHEAQVAHRACRGANIQRIARGYQHNAQSVEIRGSDQDGFILTGSTVCLSVAPMLLITKNPHFVP